MHTSRREFLASATAASVPALSPAPTPDRWWERPMRWAQLTLVEDDPGQFDPNFWLDYFRRIRADAACLSAGGCIAYYPTRVPLHYQSRWMKDTDPLGELVSGCRKMGMAVIARTDPHACHQDAHDAHPEWIAVDAGGNQRRHWAYPEKYWVTCPLGPYGFEFMTEVTREIVRMYGVDGIFSNRWSGSGMCYCEHCRANFRAAYNLDLPRTSNPRDPARRNYILWRQQRLFDLWRLWDAEIRKINPNACAIPNAGGGALSELDMKTIGELAPTLMADRQARRGLAPPWMAGMSGKEYRATLGRKPVVGIFSVGIEEQYRWKDSVQTAAEIRLWVADALANGMRPWFTKFAGTLRDPRWLKTVEEMYVWQSRVEKYLRNEEPLARVATVYSQQSAWFYAGQSARQKLEDPSLGFYQALVEARIPFEMAHDRLLDAAHLDKFKLLILPNIAALSDAQCEQLRQFVKRGGGLVATYETSLYDEWGARRKDFGLADLFGVRFAGRLEPRLQNSYLRLDHSTRHAILRGLEDAPRIINAASRVVVEPVVKMPSPPVTLVPSYPDLPMEEVYPRQPKTDTAEVYLREFGQGRVVYIPSDLDRTFWEVMARDHALLLRNVVEWALNEPHPVEVEGPGVFDVTLWRQKESMTVHLVNLTNPMMMKGPCRELIPSAPQRVRVRLPRGAKAKRVQLLSSGITPQVTSRGRTITVMVPAVLDLEVVAIDL